LLSLAGCQLFRPDGGGEVDLTAPGNVIVGLPAIADNQTPGLFYTFSTVGITNVVQGMA